MKERLKQFVRTKFLGWSAPSPSEAERAATITLQAELARAFLDHDIVVQAYQTLLDQLVDRILNTPAEQREQILLLHGQARSLMALVFQMRVYLNEEELLTAERDKKNRLNPDPTPNP